MSKLTMFLASVMVLTMAVVFAGCSGNGESNSSDDSNQSQSDDTDHGHEHGPGADHSHGDDGDDGDAEKEKMLADLSEEDRALVEKQRTCPVNGGLLWGMGKPYKTTVKDSSGPEHVVFLCCDSCEEELEANADKYLAKLGK